MTQKSGTPTKPTMAPPAPRKCTEEYPELFNFVEHLIGRRLYEYEAVVIKTLIKAEAKQDANKALR